MAGLAQLALLLVQSTAAAEGATVDAVLTASPTFGEAIGRNDGDDLIDEIEFAAALKGRFPVSAKTEITLTPRIAYSPGYYRDDNPKSSLSMQVGVQRKSRFASLDGSAEMGEWDATEAQTYLRYTALAGYVGAFDRYDFTDHVATAGIRFGNKLYLLCNLPWLQRRTAKCSETGAIGFAIDPSVDLTGSTSAARRRVTPGVKLDATFPLGGIALFTNVRAEHRIFYDTDLPAGGVRRDTRLAIDAGFDLSFLFDRVGLPARSEFRLGGRYVRNRSNRATENFNRVFFVPMLSLARRLP